MGHAVLVSVNVSLGMSRLPSAEENMFLHSSAPAIGSERDRFSILWPRWSCVTGTSPHLVSLCFSAVPVILPAVYNKRTTNAAGWRPVREIAGYSHEAGQIALTHYKALRIRATPKCSNLTAEVVPAEARPQ